MRRKMELLASSQVQRGWFTILRIYSPPQPWIDQIWRPGEIELVP